MNINEISMAIDIEKAAKDAVKLNELLKQLNTINASYSRHVGTMVMVSNDTENRIMAIIMEAEETRSKLSKLPTEALDKLTDLSGDQYKAFLNDVQKVLENNRREVIRAKEFLSRYYRH